MAPGEGIAISERVHIGFFGRCNSGKSSLINAITGQAVSVVSEQAGTTTDAVQKNIELPGIGAAVLIDTAGFDDESELGQQRIEKTRQVMSKSDIAVLLFVDRNIELELKWLHDLRKNGIAIVAVLAQCDKIEDDKYVIDAILKQTNEPLISVSAKTGEGIDKLLEKIAHHNKQETRLLTGGLCKSGDTVMLVMPQDQQAPKGRLIKPQMEVLRELLDKKCVAMCCGVDEYSSALASLKTTPQLIITDSQVFKRIYDQSPKEVPITSFSILFARKKGDINKFVEGAKAIASLTNNSRVLIAEACSHIPQNEDIGRVKLPRMLRKYVGEDLVIDVVGGNDYPQDLSKYDLIIHCGACMFNRSHVMNRVSQAINQEVPITNYGVAIAFLNGILDDVVY